MIKAIFFDIDGTLVPMGRNRMSLETIDALKEIKKKDIKIFLASGRGVRELGGVTRDAVFDGYVTLNGQMCLDGQGELYFGNEIPSEDLKILCEIFKTKEIPAVIIEKDRTYMNDTNEFTEALHKEIGIKGSPVGEYEGDKVYQIILYADSAYAEKLFQRLPGRRWSRWHRKGIDVFSKNGGKITGIQKTLEHYGIDRKEIMAFGDGDNDVEMLSFAEIGVAMGNAVEAAKKTADYVTDTAEKNGIVTALKHFGII